MNYYRFPYKAEAIFVACPSSVFYTTNMAAVYILSRIQNILLSAEIEMMHHNVLKSLVTDDN